MDWVNSQEGFSQTGYSVSMECFAYYIGKDPTFYKDDVYECPVFSLSKRKSSDATELVFNGNKYYYWFVWFSYIKM